MIFIAAAILSAVPPASTIPVYEVDLIELNEVYRIANWQEREWKTEREWRPKITRSVRQFIFYSMNHEGRLVVCDWMMDGSEKYHVLPDRRLGGWMLLLRARDGQFLMIKATAYRHSTTWYDVEVEERKNDPADRRIPLRPNRPLHSSQLPSVVVPWKPFWSSK